MKNISFCLESGPGKEEYIKIWEMAKSSHDPEGWFLIQTGSKSITDVLYALIGLKIINSHSYQEVRNSISKTDKKINSSIDFNKGEELISISEIVNYIDNKVFKKPV